MEQKIKFPRSQKVYLPGKLYPNIRVAMRKVEQVPSVSFEGEVCLWQERQFNGFVMSFG